MSDKRNELWKTIKSNGWDREFLDTRMKFNKAKEADLEAFISYKGEVTVDEIVNNVIASRDSTLESSPVAGDDSIGESQESFMAEKGEVAVDLIVKDLDSTDEAISVPSDEQPQPLSPSEDESHMGTMTGLDEYSSVGIDAVEDQAPILKEEYVDANMTIEGILNSAGAMPDEDNFTPDAVDDATKQYDDQVAGEDYSHNYVNSMRSMVMPCPVCYAEMGLSEDKGLWVCPNCGENPTFDGSNIDIDKATQMVGQRLGPGAGSVGKQFKGLSDEEVVKKLQNLKNQLPDDYISQATVETQQAPDGHGGQPLTPQPIVSSDGKPIKTVISDRAVTQSGGVISDKPADDNFTVAPITDPALKPRIVSGEKGLNRHVVNYDSFRSSNAPEGSRNRVARHKQGRSTVTPEEEARGLKPLPPSIRDDARHAPITVVQKGATVRSSHKTQRRAVTSGGYQVPVIGPDAQSQEQPLPPPPDDWDPSQMPTVIKREMSPIDRQEQGKVYIQRGQEIVHGSPPRSQRVNQVQRANITNVVKDQARGMPSNTKNRKSRKIIRH